MKMQMVYDLGKVRIYKNAVSYFKRMFANSALENQVVSEHGYASIVLSSDNIQSSDSAAFANTCQLASDVRVESHNNVVEIKLTYDIAMR